MAHGPRLKLTNDMENLSMMGGSLVDSVPMKQDGQLAEYGFGSGCMSTMMGAPRVDMLG